jgi:hypothetical protein
MISEGGAVPLTLALSEGGSEGEGHGGTSTDLSPPHLVQLLLSRSAIYRYTASVLLAV